MLLWQIFPYDFNGVQIELNFHSQAEDKNGVEVDSYNFPKAAQGWFDPSCYERFRRAAIPAPVPVR